MRQVEELKALPVAAYLSDLGDQLMKVGVVPLVHQQAEVQVPEGFVGVFIEYDGCSFSLHMGDFGEEAARGFDLPGR